MASGFAPGFASGFYNGTQDLQRNSDAHALVQQQLIDAQAASKYREFLQQQTMQEQQRAQDEARLGIDALRGPIPPAPGQASQPGQPPQQQQPQGPTNPAYQSPPGLQGGGIPVPPQYQQQPGQGGGQMPGYGMPQAPGGMPPGAGGQMPGQMPGGPQVPPGMQLAPYQRMGGTTDSNNTQAGQIPPKPSSIVDRIADAAAERGITDPIAIYHAVQGQITMQQAHQAAVMAQHKMDNEDRRLDQGDKRIEADSDYKRAMMQRTEEQTRLLRNGQRMSGGGPAAGGGGGGTAAPADANDVQSLYKQAKKLGMSEKTLDKYAESYNLTGKFPANMGRSKADIPKRDLIANRANQMEGGGSAAQTQSNQADYKALSGALNALEKFQGVVGSYESTAIKSADMLAGLADKGASPTTFNKINQWINSGRVQTNDPDVIKFNNAMETFVSEYAKIMSGGTGAAASTEGAQNRAHTLLNAGMNKGTIQTVVNQLKQEMKFRIDSNKEQIKQTRDRIKGIGKPEASLTEKAGVNSPPPPAGFQVLN